MPSDPKAAVEQLHVRDTVDIPRRNEQRRREGLDAGADDFITKPFQPEELQVRLRAGERLLSLESRDVTIFALAKLAESRDLDTGAHLDRIREYCRILCEHLLEQGPYVGQIDGDFLRMVYLTSPLHDIGKVGIPDRILLKPGKLTAEEFEIMKQHAQIGSDTLDAALQTRPDAQFLKMARDIAHSHHEKFDGSGYPSGLKGQNIPLCGRIVALADVYDALTTKRVYKPAFSHEESRAIILEGSGKHFDPAIVDAFLESESKFVAVRQRFSDEEIGRTAGTRLQAAADPSAPLSDDGPNRDWKRKLGVRRQLNKRCSPHPERPRWFSAGATDGTREKQK